MDFAPDGMAGPVPDAMRHPARCDVAADRVVHLEATQGPASGRCLLNQVDAGIAGTHNDRKRLAHRAGTSSPQNAIQVDGFKVHGLFLGIGFDYPRTRPWVRQPPLRQSRVAG
jgi:hypothetical protein